MFVLGSGEISPEEPHDGRAAVGTAVLTAFFEVPLNEISRTIILTGLVLLLGMALVFLSAFLLRFLYKPWVLLILSLTGVVIIGLVIKNAGAKSE